MDCLIKEKKNKKIIIWTLDGSPKFYQVEFQNLEIHSNYNLKIVWNRPIKGITNNAITIKFSHSDVFFEEKTVSVNQFILQHDELLNEIYSNINKKLILQGLTIEKNSKLVLQKINKYAKKVIKYINKKELKKDSKSNKKST